ncbi:MAG TPA: hypothetical protein VKU02_08940 [Gemmataceae bacterium]|nr:hypothetical protein [Gemmataceae bacterium]
MAERFVCQQVPAGAARLTAAGEPEETLVQDVRADLTPAQMVEHKLMALLKGSAPGAFLRSRDAPRDRARERNVSFGMLDAMQEGKQRAVAGPRNKNSAAKKIVVGFLQIVQAPLPESAH